MSINADTCQKVIPIFKLKNKKTIWHSHCMLILLRESGLLTHINTWHCVLFCYTPLTFFRIKRLGKQQVRKNANGMKSIPIPMW